MAPRDAEFARLEAERATLAERERMYRFSAGLGAYLVWAADAAGRVVILEYPFRLTGRSSEDGLGEGWLEIVHADDRERVAALWRAAVAASEPYRAEFRALIADGSYRMMRSRAAPVRDEGGAIRRWYGITEDIEEERLAEVARREVETRYRLAVQATDDAVWDYDIAAREIEWSDNAGPIFGLGDGSPGRTSFDWWLDRVHADDRGRIGDILKEITAHDQSRWSASYRFRREDGSYADILDRGFIIRGADGNAVRAVGAMADMTDRHRAEAELRRVQGELIHVSRLSAMGTMASTLAHELNQPLTALANFISGTRRLAGRPDVSREVVDEALEGAETAARRAGEILRRLRDLVSRGTVSIVVEHLPQLIEEACVLAFVDEQSLGVRHRLVLDPAAEWIRADRIQIQQVLINLVRNAVEALAGSARREVVISTRAAGDMVEIEVADSGVGISPDHLDTLFSEFMTTKNGGMGLGLPISRTIVEAHGGKISAGNAKAGGAVFVFTLPRARRRKDDPPRL
jgi:two-component system, LuxR family, sensor kinase FixL